MGEVFGLVMINSEFDLTQWTVEVRRAGIRTFDFPYLASSRSINPGIEYSASSMFHFTMNSETEMLWKVDFKG